MILVVVASSTVACGGRKKPPKSPGRNCYRRDCFGSFTGEEKWTAGVKGKLTVMIREVLGGQLAFHGGERKPTVLLERERLQWWRRAEKRGELQRG